MARKEGEETLTDTPTMIFVLFVMLIVLGSPCMMIALLWWGIAEVEDMYEKENKNNSGAGSEKEENK